jgi:hypothetical protein
VKYKSPQFLSFLSNEFFLVLFQNIQRTLLFGILLTHCSYDLSKKKENCKMCLYFYDNRIYKLFAEN